MKSLNFIAIGIAALAGSQTVSAVISDAEAAEMLRLLNNLRLSKGIPELALEQRLNSLAEDHSLDMSNNCVMQHEGSDGTTIGARVDREGIQWRLAGENIAAGQADVQTVMDDWIASPPHLENLQNPRYNFVGFGKSINSACDVFDVYWTQDFANIEAGAIPDPAGVQAPTPIGRTKSQTARPKTTTTTTTTTTKKTTTTTTIKTTAPPRRSANNLRVVKDVNSKTKTKSKKTTTQETPTPTPEPEEFTGGSREPQFVAAKRFKCVPKSTSGELTTSADAYGGGQESYYSNPSTTTNGTDAQALTAAAYPSFGISQAVTILCILLPLVFM